MKYYPWLLLLPLVAVCRLAIGGEGVIASNDPMSGFLRFLLDYGSMGGFVAYLIWQKNHDNKQRIIESDRWHKLDERIIDLTVECTKVMTEVERALEELRKEVASGR